MDPRSILEDQTRVAECSRLAIRRLWNEQAARNGEGGIIPHTHSLLQNKGATRKRDKRPTKSCPGTSPRSSLLFPAVSSSEDRDSPESGTKGTLEGSQATVSEEVSQTAHIVTAFLKCWADVAVTVKWQSLVE
jgi:hypothetical protein